MMLFLRLKAGHSYTLHPLPFSYKVNVSEPDHTQWTTFDFEFCRQVKLHACAVL